MSSFVEMERVAGNMTKPNLLVEPVSLFELKQQLIATGKWKPEGLQQLDDFITAIVRREANRFNYRASQEEITAKVESDYATKKRKYAADYAKRIAGKIFDMKGELITLGFPQARPSGNLARVLWDADRITTTLGLPGRAVNSALPLLVKAGKLDRAKFRLNDSKAVFCYWFR